MRNYSKIIKNTVLWLVVLFSLAIIATSLDIFGNRQFVDVSGSMEPKIKTGSVVIDRPQSNYKVGDIITFKVAGSKDTVTHRIVKVEKDAAGNTFYTVKGDANPAPDADPVAKADVVGKVSFSIPYIGYLVRYIRTLPGLIVFIIVPATLLIYDELMNINTEIANLRAAKRKVAAEAKKLEEALEDEEKKIATKLKSKPKAKITRGKPYKIVTGMVLVLLLGAMGLGSTSSLLSSSVNLTGITFKTGGWPTSAADCKDGGWQNYPNLKFKNQGDCVSYIATHGRNQPSG